ncbi:MAG TPA: serine/threonine-protein kinase [Kofleriaceae bacterium]|nr:serine/threonine-protein kinase [Kofleriaceae bacterium]
MGNSPARGTIDVGSVIADTYTIEALLGRGGMGAVFLASHKRLAGKQVAIKILHTEVEDTDVVARFKREAEIAARLNHPNIVGVIDYNLAPDGTPYLVLDYLEGETLAQRIARGPLPLEQVLSIVRQVGAAVAAAHRAGIVHRDLKPQNIFLVPTVVDGREVEIAKVLDFGISKIRGSQTVKTQDSMLLGTPQYMAPEQATGQHAIIDDRTDVFALGAIVYEMLCGQPAFSGASIPEVVFKVVYEQPPPLELQAPSVPSAIVTAVAQAMAKAAEERFATVAGFVEAITGQPLTLTRGQASTGAEPPSTSQRVATGEAFAQTMGSGPFGHSPIHSQLATLGMEPAGAPGAPARPVSTVDLRVARAEPPKPHRRSASMIAVIALAGAAVAVGAMYLVVRPGDLKRQEPTQGTRPADTRPADTRPADIRPADARPEPKSPGKRDPRPSTVHDAKPPAPDLSDGSGDDSDVHDNLLHAAAASEQHNYDLAERLANAVINAPASPKQHANARLLHGTIQCIARSDQEAAQIDLRNLDGFRALKARLIAVCRSHGILLSAP